MSYLRARGRPDGEDGRCRPSGRRGAGEAARHRREGTAEAVEKGGDGRQLTETRRLDDAVRHTRLPNGAEVVTEAMASVHSAAVGYWFRRGTAHEHPDERGVAHLLEHMVFKGTIRRSAREIALAIEGVGGSLDAYTTHEHTSFQARVPASRLRRSLDVLSDLAFQPRLAAEDLEKEREVVVEELARMEETPEDLVFDLHAEFLYGGHEYGAPILGTRRTLGRLDEKTLRRVHTESFVPGNLVVAAAGEVDHGRLVEEVARRLPDGSPVAGEQAELEAPARWGVGTRRVRRPGSRQVHLAFGLPGVRYGSSLRHATVVLSTALGGGMSSRLFQRVREELGLAYSVFSFHAFFSAAGHVGAYVGTSEEEAARAREVVEQELARLASSGLAEAESLAARELLKGQLMLTMESPAARMHRLATMALYREPYRSVEESARLIEGVSDEELEQTAALYDPGRLAVVELWPA